MNAPRVSTRRTARRRRWLPWPARVVLLWAAAVFPLLVWGLPSAQHDDLLFGGSPAWPAERYGAAEALQALRARDAGADTDLDPLAPSGELVDLTADEPARAEILRRYRLYSRQPDEHIIFRALQRMSPRRLDFDPQLYQYGGAYIYLVGAALGVASASGALELSADAGAYLAEPGLFARFYLVARLVSLVFGALALLAVHQLGRRTGGRLAGWLAMLCVMLSPVFLTAVLEAKPHLPSACLVVWAVLAALDYQRRGRCGDAFRLGLWSGGAFALVLTGAVTVVLWPAVLVTARRRALAALAAAGGVALLVWLVTNPYVPYSLLAGRDAVGDNLRNSAAMYAGQMRQAGAGAVRVGQLLLEGVGLGVVAAGVVGLAVLGRRRPGPTLVAASVGAAMILVCVLLGAHKPAEFARFLILPALLLAVAAGGLLAAVVRRRFILGLLLTLGVVATLRTPAYVRAFVADARGCAESRAAAGRFLAAQLGACAAVGVLQEPAPYAVPPLDFTRRQVVLLPPGAPAEICGDELPPWLVYTADDDTVHEGAWWKPHYQFVQRFPRSDTPLSPITWANKAVYIYRRLPQ